MKIGFDVAQTCSERAGCAWYADALLRALVDLAPEHHFFLYHQFGRWQNADTHAGTHLSRTNVTESFTDVSPAEAARIWQNPAELVIKTGEPDIVHANCFQAPKVPGAKLVYTIYDVSFWAKPEYTTEQNRLICQRGMLEALAHADGFIFISQNAHDEFERIVPGWLEQHSRPWAVTPLAPRMGEIAVPEAAANPYWLAVGSIEPRKNYDVLLDALELYWSASTRRLPLHIAGGRGWKSERLHSRFARLAEKGMVKYLGYVPDAALPALYASAEALIFPSWYEGFGLPVLEAMTLGCPVISSNRTSLPEVGGQTVTYVDPADPRQIATAMLTLETDSALRERMIRDGLVQAASFSWEKTARDTLAFYEQILSTEKSRPA